MKHCLTLVFVFLSIAVSAQENKVEKIAKATADYFFLERENIHAHFDKTIFFTNETIWFKGYIYHRKKALPFYNTTNVYANLIDETGKVVDSRLFYSNLGTLSGYFNLDRKYKSGKYYIQLYTNWMNNFAEDESFVQEVTIINENDNPASVIGKKPAAINISVSPEGGKIIKGVTNTVGISVTACGGKPIPVTTANVLDKNGRTIATVQLNSMGNGRYDIPANMQPAKIRVEYNGKAHEQPLPPTEASGITLSVNNYAVAGKVMIKMRTNPDMLTAVTGNVLYLVIQRDEKAQVFEVVFVGNEPEQTLVLPSEQLYTGMNTLRLLDENLNELSSRLVYNYPSQTLSADVSPAGRTEIGNLKYTGKSQPNMNLSITVLPETTLGIDSKNDIYGSLLIAPYIKGGEKAAGNYYLGKPSKVKHYELDLFLLGQQPKHSWFSIINSPPKPVFTFDMGLQLKGKVPVKVKKKEYRVRLVSAQPFLDEYTGIGDNNEFSYKNIIVFDSASVQFKLASIADKKDTKDFLPGLQVLHARKPFGKPYSPAPPCEMEPIDTSAVTDDYMPPKFYKETIVLETVKVEAKRLKYQNIHGNTSLNGYKIEDNISGFQSIITWLGFYSNFNVVDNNVDISITGRSRTTINGAPSSPVIFLDNVQVFDLSLLRSIYMSDVDEVYMSSTAIVSSIRNNQGIVRIYMKKNPGKVKTSTSKSELVKNGFASFKRFENVQYMSTSDKAFENFGLVDWHSVVMTKEDGTFSFSIPVTSQKTVKLLIEGMSTDGKIISEIKTISAE